jgi:hypothetical protein
VLEIVSDLPKEIRDNPHRGSRFSVCLCGAYPILCGSSFQYHAGTLTDVPVSAPTFGDGASSSARLFFPAPPLDVTDILHEFALNKTASTRNGERRKVGGSRFAGIRAWQQLCQ